MIIYLSSVDKSWQSGKDEDKAYKGMASTSLQVGKIYSDEG